MRKSAIGLAASATIVGGIAVHEGYRGEAYLDPVGVRTIAFGATAGVQPGDQTDPVRAVVRLVADIDATSRAVSRCIGDVPLYQHEFDAYVSLAYNIGSGAFCGSTLLKLLRNDPPQYEAACAQILRWRYAKGAPLPGLVTRRAHEYRMCMGTPEL